MATSLSYTFNLNIPTTNLTVGEKIVFKLYNSSPPSDANFTASLLDATNNNVASLVISSLATSTGYSTVTTGSANINAGGFFDSASIADTGSNDIVFSQALSGFWDNNYIFVPNPITSSNATPYTNTLYSSSIANYGDVDYPFSPVIPCYDIVLIYLNDGTYIEARVTNTYKDNNVLLNLTLDTNLTSTLRLNLINRTYQQFLLLSRRADETNTILNFTKRDGKTSYGFLIPEDINQDVLNNIDTITKETKQKLLNESTTNNI